MNDEKKCVLAYSGGLDTSAIIPWLLDHGYEVHCALVDVGQEEDFDEIVERALHMGAASATVCDAKPVMTAQVLPLAIGLHACYEGSYRLGTALARPFIALEQVRLARELGCKTLVHGATGKGNDQIRFEFAYRSLAPECEVLAPWKCWEFEGRQDLADYLKAKGFTIPFEVHKELSLDENLWHLSVEGGVLEQPGSMLAVEEVLEAVAERFAPDAPPLHAIPKEVELTFERGVPVAVNGERLALGNLINRLNHTYRHASWAWDLVLENRFTGVKSRGIYINPAARLLHFAVDGLARTCFNKPAFDAWRKLGDDYAGLLYRGEFFSQQRRVVAAAGHAAMDLLRGTVTVRFAPSPYLARVEAAQGLFQESIATFEKSDFHHSDAAGFIALSWLSSIGRAEPQETPHDQDALEAGSPAESDVPADSSVPEGGLVPSSS